MPSASNLTKRYEYVKLGVPHDWIAAVRSAKWDLRRPYGEVLRTAMAFGLIQMGLVDVPPELERPPFHGAEPVIWLNEITGRLTLAGWSGEI